MSVREQIMAVGNPYIGGHGQDLFEHGKRKCADIAETREKELLAEKAALIAELRGLIEPELHNLVRCAEVKAILAKHGGKP